MPGNKARSQFKGLEYIFDKSYFIHAIPGQFPVKKSWFQQFSSFATIDYTGRFRKILTWTFNFGCFSWYHVYLFEKKRIKFPDAEFNAELVGTNFKSQN